MLTLLGCGTEPNLPGVGAAGAATAGAAGSSSAATASAAGSSSAPAADESRAFTWAVCGTIPSTEVSLFREYSRGEAIVGGHPHAPPPERTRITALAMSADGGTLVSMGGVTLVWDVAPAFSDSRATYVDYGSPEWPRVEVSPDGRWVAISGDGRRLVSRDGVDGPIIRRGFDSTQCWPAEARFSPDGKWLVGADFGPGIDVFRVADFDGAGGSELKPVVSLPAPCGPPMPGAVNLRSSTRVAFTPDGARLQTETGAQFNTDDWQLIATGSAEPSSHTYSGDFELSATGASLLSDCEYDTGDGHRCAPDAGRFPRFSPDGSWVVAGGVLRHVASGATRLLDQTATVGIFAPNGDVIVASADNTLTRYCRAD